MDYVAITGRNESSCGYCHAPSESSISFGLWAYSLRCDTYQRLLDRGWRRSGKYLYKPELAETCCSLVTIRLDVAKYALSRGQKKVVKKMRRFIAEGKRPGKYGADVGQDGEDATQDMDVDSSGPSGGEKQEFPTREPPQFSDASRLRDQEASVPITKSKMYPPQSAQHIPNPDTKGGGPQPSSTERPGSSSQPVLGGGQLPPSKSKPKPKPPPPTDILSLISQTEEPTSHPGSQTLKVVLERAAFNDEVFQLYSKYQIAVHHDPPHKLTPSAFKRFLVDSPLVFEPPTPTTPGYGTFHQKYYLNNRLVAVGVLDILPNCISSVYLMYDPDISFLSMGTYSAIREIALTVKLRKELPQLKYYYMGYYVQTCPKMRYKANYKPSEILCPGTFEWVPASEAVPILEQYGVGVLAGPLKTLITSETGSSNTTTAAETPNEITPVNDSISADNSTPVHPTAATPHPPTGRASLQKIKQAALETVADKDIAWLPARQPDTGLMPFRAVPGFETYKDDLKELCAIVGGIKVLEGIIFITQ